MILAELEQWSPWVWIVLGICSHLITAGVCYCVGFEEGAK